jgi:hypothetical protein
MTDTQCSKFHLLQDGEINRVLPRYWCSSQNPAFFKLNAILQPNDLLFEFVEHIKDCRFFESGDQVQRPLPHKRLDLLADCLKRLAFTVCQRDDTGELTEIEATLLDFAIGICFDLSALDHVRTFRAQGVSREEVELLSQAIWCYVKAAGGNDDAQ